MSLTRGTARDSYHNHVARVSLGKKENTQSATCPPPTIQRDYLRLCPAFVDISGVASGRFRGHPRRIPIYAGPIKSHGSATTTMAARHVAHTTSKFASRPAGSLLRGTTLSVITGWSSWGSLVNSSTSTSQRNFTLDDSRRQNMCPEFRRSRHHTGSEGRFACIVMLSIRLFQSTVFLFCAPDPYGSNVQILSASHENNFVLSMLSIPTSTG